MKINVKLIDGGKMPERKTKDAACFDCYSRANYTIQPGETVVIPLGFKIEVP